MIRDGSKGSGARRRTLDGWRFCELGELETVGPVWEAHSYWLSKWHNGDLPSRRDLAPTEIPQLLARTVLIDCLLADDFRIRLMGSYVVEHDGRDLTGKIIDKDSFGDATAFFRAAFVRARDSREAVFFTGTLIWEKRHYKAFVQAVLPLVSDGGTIESLFCIVNFGPPQPR